MPADGEQAVQAGALHYVQGKQAAGKMGHAALQMKLIRAYHSCSQTWE
jgi:hypothetical protein